MTNPTPMEGRGFGGGSYSSVQEQIQSTTDKRKFILGLCRHNRAYFAQMNS